LAVLLVAEQVAGAAMLEVGHRQFETAAALGLDQLTQSVDSPLGVAGDDVLAGNQQVRGRLLARASDASAQLVKLRKTKMGGAIDDHRVGVGNAEARFDNRAADQ